MKKIYFISYVHQTGSGCCEIFMDNEIESYEDIKNLIKEIEKNEGTSNVIIMNFKLLKKTYFKQGTNVL